jgi:hypothetical protein
MDVSHFLGLQRYGLHFSKAETKFFSHPEKNRLLAEEAP